LRHFSILAGSLAALVLSLFPSKGHSDLLKPWLGNLFEFQLTGSYTFQHFSRVRTYPDTVKLSTNANYFDIDLGLVLLPTLNVGVNLGTQKVMGKNLYFDTAKIFGQYLVFDDIVGDPISMTINLSLASTDTKALANLGKFHHGRFESVLSASVGREWAIGRIFTHRIWANVGFGGSTRSSLFSKESLSWQINFIDRIRIGAFGIFNGGFGKKRLTTLSDFTGYRHTRYRAIDAGLSLKYRWDIWGDMKFQFTRRFWGRSCPENGYSFQVMYHLPFSAF